MPRAARLWTNLTKSRSAKMGIMASFPKAREIPLAWVPDQHPGPFDFNGEIVGGLKTPSPHVYGGRGIVTARTPQEAIWIAWSCLQHQVEHISAWNPANINWQYCQVEANKYYVGIGI